MKKAISLLLALVMCLSLCACGGGNSDTPDTPDTTEATQASTAEATQAPAEPSAKLALGESAITDIAGLKLDSSEFCYYMEDTLDETYLTPTDEANDYYAASVGYCYVAMTFTISNIDRGGSLDVCAGGWDILFTASYNGQEYPLRSFVLWDNGGNPYVFQLDTAVITDKTGKSELRTGDSVNYILHAGETITIRTFGIINVDPESLTDGYELTINVPNSKGEYEYFTYTIPARS